MQQFITISTFYDKSDEHHEKIKELIQKVESISKQAEIILLMNDYTHFKNLDINQLSTNKVQVKAVSTYKYSKDYVFENVAWQAAIGDILIYHPEYSYLIDYLEQIIKSYTKNENHILFLVDRYDDMNRNKRRFTFKKINQAYLQHQNETIDPSTNGYVINRFAINACFNNQKEQYDPLIAIATSGLSSSKFKPDQEEGIGRASRKIKDYQISDILDMLTYYTKYGVHQLMLYSILIILFVTALLTTVFIHVPFIAILIGLIGIVFSILIGVYPQFIVARQTFAAANEKNVVGHFEIKNL